MMSVSQTREMLIEGSMKRWDSKGRMSMGTPSHKPPVTKSGRVDYTSDHRSTAKSIFGSTDKGSVEWEYEGGKRGSVRDRKPVSSLALWRCGARKQRCSKPAEETSWEGSERRGGSRRQKRRDDERDGGTAGSLRRRASKVVKLR